MALSLFAPKPFYAKSDINSVLLLEPGKVPTTFFYALPRISESLKKKTRCYNSILRPPRKLELKEGTWVIIVRHASREWLKQLKAHSSKISKVTYIQDDDIPAILDARELPFFYRLRTWWRYYTTHHLLSEVVSEIALSTEELANRYSNVRSTIWEPIYQYREKMPSPSSNELVYFYHGTITHRHEMKWLLPIVAQVQERCPDAWFELMGDASMKKVFQKIPRIRVLPSMKWSVYYDYLGTLNYAIGLAPLLDTSFNRARAHTKLYQITDAGAAGIFSDITPYSKKIIHGTNGILCSNDPNAWIKAIIDLLTNKEQREALHHRACISFSKTPV